ncbi:hypothetical protein PSECIP111951_00969 [Pseudoalteromonas holothuriae]|uniref:Uncharacterized protein n=1 Tax=Pseudoalteromonas holothuriae TaxID=2963714 RepID=A0A9W4QYS1_9GAMM|nr:MULTISPECIES: hypothetical protein [unclassified Pseudoalteromonas]CAH9054149.1 hypothetical protein PSECIP111951_00969 [Pseudoalteromonas sp. CIP111951]CAH9059180.1 hypothetical protein PSECIP111854_02349 [Pseudoalteromonas sp. CIP111854]
MNVIVILVSLIVALLILVPLLERYQHKMGLHKMQRYSKYILPLIMVSLVIRLLYMLWFEG